MVAVEILKIPCTNAPLTATGIPPTLMLSTNWVGANDDPTDALPILRFSPSNALAPRSNYLSWHRPRMQDRPIAPGHLPSHTRRRFRKHLVLEASIDRNKGTDTTDDLFSLASLLIPVAHSVLRAWRGNADLNLDTFDLIPSRIAF